jgi:hypothetical protein
MRNYKAPEPAPLFEAVNDSDTDDEIRKCSWCDLEFESDQLIPTDLGMLCERCIAAIRSRGEQVTQLA